MKITTVPESLQEEISYKIVNGDLPTFKEFELKGFIFYAEEWETCCIEEKLEGDEDDDDLFDIMFEKAEKIKEEEGWSGYFYIAPEECGVALGITVFYRKRT